MTKVRDVVGVALRRSIAVSCWSACIAVGFAAAGLKRIGAQTPPQQLPAGDASQQSREQDRAFLVRRGLEMDAQKLPTVENATERLHYWEELKLSFIGDPEILPRYQQALADLDEAKRRESARKATDSSSAATAARLERATRALLARNLDDANSTVDEVLAANPNDQRAILLKERIGDAIAARRLKIVLFALAGAAGILMVGVGFVANKLMKRQGQEKKEAAVAAAQRKAVVQIVDGIGRGKLYTVEGEIFRIGAAASERSEEKNHLILSDSAAAVSRFHCSIVKKGADYFLIDSSLNGTWLNGEPVLRGDQHALADGDEFIIAQVSRLKFLTA